jgi:hypothetical protein
MKKEKDLIHINIKDGKVCDDISQSFFNGFSTHLARTEQRQDIHTKLSQAE